MGVMPGGGIEAWTREDPLDLGLDLEYSHIARKCFVINKHSPKMQALCD
jgi:hypothetical protein